MIQQLSCMGKNAENIADNMGLLEFYEMALLPAHS